MVLSSLRQVPHPPLLPHTRGEEEAGGEVGAGGVDATTGDHLATCGEEGGVAVPVEGEGGDTASPGRGRLHRVGLARGEVAA